MSRLLQSLNGYVTQPTTYKEPHIGDCAENPVRRTPSELDMNHESWSPIMVPSRSPLVLNVWLTSNVVHCGIIVRIRSPNI